MSAVLTTGSSWIGTSRVHVVETVSRRVIEARKRVKAWYSEDDLEERTDGIRNVLDLTPSEVVALAAEILEAEIATAPEVVTEPVTEEAFEAGLVATPEVVAEVVVEAPVPERRKRLSRGARRARARAHAAEARRVEAAALAPKAKAAPAPAPLPQPALVATPTPNPPAEASAKAGVEVKPELPPLVEPVTCVECKRSGEAKRARVPAISRMRELLGHRVHVEDVSTFIHCPRCAEGHTSFDFKDTVRRVQEADDATLAWRIEEAREREMERVLGPDLARKLQKPRR